MKFEKISSANGKKGILIGFVIAFILVIVINLFFTRAKYKLVESRKLASGTINYTLVDFELVEIKIKGLNDSEYGDGITTIPEGDYVLNEEDSYCTEKYVREDNSFEDVRNDNLKINFDSKTKTISVSPYSKKGTKCHLYLEEIQEPKLLNEAVMAQSTKQHIEKITGPSCDSSLDNCEKTDYANMKQNGVYEAEDDYGTSYYYRGTVDNNWVKFGKATSGTEIGDIWWRIIRINGNGSIRLVYAGTYTSGETPIAKDAKNLIYPTTNVGNDSNPRVVYFNVTFNDNKYVGYMYNNSPNTSNSFDNAHKVTSSSTKSTILTQLDLWWQQTNLGSLQDAYIDTDVGFCSDTQVNNTDEMWWSRDSKIGYGIQPTAYGAYGRLMSGVDTTVKSEQYPILKCGVNPSKKIVDTEAQKRDLYTYKDALPVKTDNGYVEGNKALPIPVGLITVDEVVFAGGFVGTNNEMYWLNIGQGYWTMSPCYAYNGGLAFLFYLANGAVGSMLANSNIGGARPVINLKASTKFEVGGEGSKTNPYVVVTT